MTMTVAAFDAGGPKNLGFYSRTFDQASGLPVSPPITSRGPASIGTAVEVLASALSVGPVSLGIEAPCWLPMAGPGPHPQAPQFMRKRHFEGSRSWSAPVGGYVTTAGVALLADFIRGLVNQANGPTTPTFGPGRPGVSYSVGELWLWEAFVTADYKPAVTASEDAHIADAKIAVEDGFVPLVLPKNELETRPWRADARQTVSLFGDALQRVGLVPSGTGWWQGSCMVIAPGPTLLHPV